MAHSFRDGENRPRAETAPPKGDGGVRICRADMEHDSRLLEPRPFFSTVDGSDSRVSTRKVDDFSPWNQCSALTFASPQLHPPQRYGSEIVNTTPMEAENR